MACKALDQARDVAREQKASPVIAEARAFAEESEQECRWLRIALAELDRLHAVVGDHPRARTPLE